MINSSIHSKGIITIAQGSKRYINMAKELAISLSISNPGLKKALATDSDDPELKLLYDVIIPTNSAFGIGIVQKLYMLDYSPFDETLFIDVDCLVLKDINFLFEEFCKKDVSVIGKKVTEGKIFGFSVNEMKTKLKLLFIPTFNGGTYYFKKTPKAQNVFEKAKEYLQQYDSLGIDRHRGNINEEPLMAIAMGFYEQEPIDDKGKGMYTPVGQKGVFKMDVLRGYCEFYKRDVKVSPAIMHFGGGYPEAFHYRREILKMHLYYKYKFPKIIASVIVNCSYNPVYIVYVFLYRIFKKIIKGGALKFTPLMPMFRFE
jgi:hypothetical protein